VIPQLPTSIPTSFTPDDPALHRLIRAGVISSVRNFSFASSLPSGATLTRATTGTRVNSSGVVVTEAIDVARFDYDPGTHAALGLLVEPSVTNLCLQSNSFDSATWQKSHGSAAANTVASPSGATDADTLTLSTTAYDLYQAFTGLTPGAFYTLALWVKLGTATNFATVVNDTTAWNTIAGSKTWTTADGLSTSAWKRISIRIIGPANGKLNFHLGAHGNSDAAQQTAGTVFAWGAMLVTGSIVPPDIATTTAAVTRAADILTLPLSDGVYQITYTDANGSQTAVDTVISGRVYPRDGQNHLTGITALRLRAEPALDTDAATFIAANGLRRADARAALSAFAVAVKASTVPWSDVVAWPLAPQRNKLTGATMAPFGGWTAALQTASLSNESLMRTGDTYGLYTNDGSTTTASTMTRVSIPSLPLSGDYGFIQLCRPLGNPAANRATYQVGNIYALQTGSWTNSLLTDFDSTFTRSSWSSQCNAYGHVMIGSGPAVMLAEYGSRRTIAANDHGTFTAYLGSKAVAGAVGNSDTTGYPEIILEGAVLLNNATEAKWNTLAAIAKATLAVQDNRQQNFLIQLGQSQPEINMAMHFDRQIAIDSDWRGRMTVDYYSRSNQPLSQWIGAAPYARTGYYLTDVYKGDGTSLMELQIAHETRSKRRIVLLLWHGEAGAGYVQSGTDADKDFQANTYQDQLNAFLGFIRADVAAMGMELKIILCQIAWITATGNDLTRTNTVRAAQAAVVAANPADMVLVDTTQFERNTTDNMHLDGVGRQQFVSTVWPIVKSLLPP